MDAILTGPRVSGGMCSMAGVVPYRRATRDMHATRARMADGRGGPKVPGGMCSMAGDPATGTVCEPPGSALSPAAMRTAPRFALSGYGAGGPVTARQPEGASPSVGGSVPGQPDQQVGLVAGARDELGVALVAAERPRPGLLG